MTTLEIVLLVLLVGVIAGLGGFLCYFLKSISNMRL